LKQPRKQPDALKRPDVELTAEVKFRKLRFDKVPETEVLFPGYLERETVSGTERKNLPEEVEEDVTYRDARIRYRGAGELSVPEPGNLRQRSEKE
jgi:hypothetical protein